MKWVYKLRKSYNVAMTGANDKTKGKKNYNVLVIYKLFPAFDLLDARFIAMFAGC